jgi:hypothetical protein
MRRLSLLLSLGAVAAAALFVVPAFAAHRTAVPAAGGGTTTCNGDLAPGTYHRVVVPQDAVCMGAGPVTIRSGLFVEQGATLVLGSEDQPVHTATISGGVHATNAMIVEIHFSTINGGVDLHGGSGPFGGPFDVTYNTVEDSVINGGYNEIGYDGFWNGFIRNHVHGTVNLNDNVVVDPDGNEFVTNTIHGNLNCHGNDPAPQVGDSEGEPNHVTGRETGQCVGL